MSDPSSAADGAQQEPQQRFQIQKIYIKDVSLETPNSPAIFQQQQSWKPRIDVQVRVDSNPLDDAVHEVVIVLTVTATQDDKTAFLVEVQQAGIFTVLNFPESQRGPMLGAYCPNILFPYAREAIDGLLLKAGFPPLQLAPVNFDALYMQRNQAAQEKQSATAH